MSSTPLLPAFKFEDSERTQEFDYRSAIGSLYYLVNCTRPDLAQSVGILSRYQSNYGDNEIDAFKRVLSYLNSTQDFSLVYLKGQMDLYCYVDSNLAAPRSTTGYVIYLCGNAVAWKSKREVTTALSSMEAEYVALSTAVSELLWIKYLLVELGFEFTEPQSIRG